MTKSEKMKRADYDINVAKDRMYSAVQKLEEQGLTKDAEQLMRMIYKLEAFQNKYRR